MFDRNSRGPKIDSTKAKNELRKRKKITEACSAGFKFWTPTNKRRKINFIGGHTLLNKSCWKFYILGGEFFH